MKFPISDLTPFSRSAILIKSSDKEEINILRNSDYRQPHYLSMRNTLHNHQCPNMLGLNPTAEAAADSAVLPNESLKVHKDGLFSPS